MLSAVRGHNPSVVMDSRFLAQLGGAGHASARILPSCDHAVRGGTLPKRGPKPSATVRCEALSLLDTRFGLILLYTLTVLPIVIWIMRDQFNSIPIELDEAAFVDGLSTWGAFIRIVLPLSVPGMAAAFILSLVLCWNEYFFAALLTSTDAKTLPVMVASQTGSQGINWWSMAALSTAAIAPLVIVGIFLERYIVSGLTTGAGK